MHQRAVVEHPGAVGQELVAAADERGLPRGVVVDEDGPVAGLVEERAGEPGGGIRRLVEDLAAVVVGLEGAAVHDADGGELAGAFGVERVRGLLLDDRVDLLEEGEVVAVDAVERRLREVDEPGRRRVVRGGEGVDAGGEQGVEPSRARITIQFEYVGDSYTK